ncbi:MAG: hypothetical protein WCO19_01975 [Candidatus Saccharibacteria bacterium]
MIRSTLKSFLSRASARLERQSEDARALAIITRHVEARGLVAFAHGIDAAETSATLDVLAGTEEFSEALALVRLCFDKAHNGATFYGETAPGQRLTEAMAQLCAVTGYEHTQIGNVQDAIAERDGDWIDQVHAPIVKLIRPLLNKGAKWSPPTHQLPGFVAQALNVSDAGKESIKASPVLKDAQALADASEAHG